MDPNSYVTAVAALVGVCVGASLTHFGSEQRERLARQYSYKEKQISDLYGPLLAKILDLKIYWEVADQLDFDTTLLIRRIQIKRLEQLEDVNRPVHAVHRAAQAHQRELLKDLITLIQANFHLAEPTTQILFRQLFTFAISHQVAAEHNFAIDRTQMPKPSMFVPFPPSIIEFFDDVERQHDRIRRELEQMQLNWLQRTGRSVVKHFSIMQKPPTNIPLLKITRIEPAWGSKVLLDRLTPGNLPPGTKQYRVPVLLKNTGTLHTDEYFFEITIPSSLLVPTVTYAMAIERNDAYTTFRLTHLQRRLELKHGESDYVLQLELTVTLELQNNHANIFEQIVCTVGRSADYTRNYTLDLKDLELFTHTST